MIRRVEINEPTTVRLIKTAYITEEAMRPLCDDEEELRELEALEGMSSPRLAPMMIPAEVNLAELLAPDSIAGWTMINAAFCHTHPQGNRFNDSHRGAWYCARGENAVMTAIAEVKYHLIRVYEDAGGEFVDVAPYRELLAGFMGPFDSIHDEADAPFMSTDTAIAYPAGQDLARRLFAFGGNGILYPSVRRPGGECLVAFRPALVQNYRQGQLVTMTWTGSREPDIKFG